MNLTMVQNRDHSKKTVQVVTRSKIGAFTGVSLLRSAHYIFQADNELTPSRMLRALYDLEPFTRYNTVNFNKTTKATKLPNTI